MSTETMTSRQRVIRTLNRQSVDRLPIDLGMHSSTGISAFAYWHLREHLGMDTDDIWVPILVQMLAMVQEDIRQRFHVDCIMLEPRWPDMTQWSPRQPYQFGVPTSFAPARDSAGDWLVHQGNQQMRMPDGGYFFDGAWLANWGGMDEDQAIAAYARAAERIYKETPYATCFLGSSHGGGLGTFFHGFDQAVQMLEDPGAVKAANEAALQQVTARAAKILKAMGPWIQMIGIGNDMGMQSGPMCRPALMEECVMPYYKRLCAFIHRNSDVKVFMHNCGSIRAFLPMLIDAGIDVINPVQISAADMDPAALKRDFGDRIIFWGGGCDTQNVLGTATPAQVKDHVRKLVSIFKPGGGFVFNQVHNIVGNVPPANIVAMLDTAYEMSWSSVL